MRIENRLNFLLFCVAVVLIIWSVWVYFDNKKNKESVQVHQSKNLWNFRSVDTMKYSRDLARERMGSESFGREIDTQVENIAKTGANYIGIATPYDEEFLPYMRLWVDAARKYNLNVWFRGNWSSWEGWFDYPHVMSFDEHITRSAQFVDQNISLFRDGDKFTACPECENGIQGDPRETGRVEEYRAFLIKETTVLKDKFKNYGLAVDTNYLSMNMDVARLIMDRVTTEAIGGIVTVDHYVFDPEQLALDARQLAQNSGAKIVYGEFGAPIPDITGDMTEEAQAMWLDRALNSMTNTPEIVGLSYWVNKGGSTEIWNDNNSEKEAVKILTKYFKLKR